jgi:arylsulfatase A-like enzyme
MLRCIMDRVSADRDLHRPIAAWRSGTIGWGTIGWGAIALACASLSGVGCQPAAIEARPSVLLVVLDTLRADAVSAYGSVEGTTPSFDALARDGLLYTHAYSTSAWTLPSHASLLSGQRVDQHKVGMPGQILLPEDALTLAERMSEAGYDTAAFSESRAITETFQMTQGFAFQRANRVTIDRSSGRPVAAQEEIDSVGAVRDWLETRDRDRDFLLFVNLFDVHSPYTVQSENPWVPETTTQAQLDARPPTPGNLICDELPPPEVREVLRGLYLGEASAADSKLGAILDEVRSLGGAQELITIVTSDHGELFGDRGLLGHQFSLRNPVLHIPLVVHGLPGEAPAVIDDAVSLIDIAPSVLEWTGVADRSGLPGRPLPREPGSSAPPRQLFAAYSDGSYPTPRDWEGVIAWTSKEKLRKACRPSARVFGGMATLIEYPYKFHWFEQYAAELYDLSWDPNERSDLAALEPELVARFTTEIAPLVEAAGLTGSASAVAEPASEEVVETLRQLGYID